MEDRRNVSFPGLSSSPNDYLLTTSTHVQKSDLTSGEQWSLGMKGLGETAPSDPLPSHTQKTNQKSENLNPERFLVLRPNLRLLN